MECFGTTDFDNNSRLITLSTIIISGLHCIRKECVEEGLDRCYEEEEEHTEMDKFQDKPG